MVPAAAANKKKIKIPKMIFEVLSYYANTLLEVTEEFLEISVQGNLQKKLLRTI